MAVVLRGKCYEFKKDKSNAKIFKAEKEIQLQQSFTNIQECFESINIDAM